MKAKIFLVTLLVIYVQIAWGLDVPKLKGRVNDYTDSTLTIEQKKKLEAKLKAFEESSSNQVVVLIVTSLGDEDIKDFSMKVAESWKIGQKGKDNGVILVFSIQDRRGRIEVGYGLEPVLTDAVCSWITKKEVRPLFKEKKYYEGINVAIDKIILSTTGEYQKDIAPAMEQEKKHNNALIFLTILAVIAGILGYAHWSVSGITGAIGAPIIWFLIFGAFSAMTLLIAIVIGFVGGLIAHLIMSVGFGGGITGLDSGIVTSFVGGGGEFGGGGIDFDW